MSEMLLVVSLATVASMPRFGRGGARRRGGARARRLLGAAHPLLGRPERGALPLLRRRLAADPLPGLAAVPHRDRLRRAAPRRARLAHAALGLRARPGAGEPVVLGAHPRRLHPRRVGRQRRLLAGHRTAAARPAHRPRRAGDHVRPPARRAAARAPPRLARRRHLPRPRPLQGPQRLARPRRRRPRARHRRRAPARRRPRPRHRRALRRRRVRHRLRGPARRRRGRRRRRAPRRRAARALHRRRPGDRAHRLGRHRRRRRRRRAQRRGAHPRRRRRDVPRQGGTARTATSSSARRCAPARSPASPTRSSCATRSPATSCACTTSRSSRSAAAACAPSRRTSTGSTRPAACSCRATSGPSPRRPAWSSRSAPGRSARPAPSCAGWRQAGAASDVSMSINVSALQLGDAEFIPAVEHALEANGLVPSVLCLEIPEVAVVADAGRALGDRSPSCAPSACGSRSTATAPAISR